MRLLVHFTVVVLQVVVFQLVLAGRARALSDVTFGARDLPEPAAARLKAIDRRAKTVNRILAAVLLIAAAAIMFFSPFDVGGRKLGIAIVSIASSAVLIGNLLVGRRETEDVLALLPETGRRVASLERRSLGRYYPLVWEWVGPALFAATLAMTAWAAAGTSSAGGAGLWIAPVFQAFFLAVLHFFSVRLVHGHRYVPHNTAIFAEHPEDGLALEDRLRTLKLRALLAVKILVTLEWGMLQLKRVQVLVSGEAPGWLSPIVWVPVAALLVVFAAFLVQVSRARSRAAA
jgi:hypothetical protein